MTIKFPDDTNETVVLKRIRENGLEKSRELGLAREARPLFQLVGVEGAEASSAIHIIHHVYSKARYERRMSTVFG